MVPLRAESIRLAAGSGSAGRLRRAAPVPLWGTQGPRRRNYLYFRLSATAISSQRLLYSFSAWFSHPACRMGALFYWFRCGRNQSARRQGPAPPDAYGAPRRCPFGTRKGHAAEITYISGSPPPPFHHSGYYIHFPRGFPIRLAGWEPYFIGSAAGGINPPGDRVRLRRTPGRRAAPVPLWGTQGPRRRNYLYFRLSATAISSQRLLYSFSAWPLTQW